MKHKNLILPVGTLNPVGLLIASRNTLESDADPSQPGKTNINFMSGELLIHWLQSPPFVFDILVYFVQGHEP